MGAIGELRSAPANFRQLSNQPDDRLTVVVVEIIPAHWPIEHHPPVAAIRNPVILTELLSLRQKRRAFARQQRNQIRLHLGPVVVPVSLLQQDVRRSIVHRDRPEVADETLMIVILNVLQRGLGNGVGIGCNRIRISVQPELESELFDGARDCLRRQLAAAPSVPSCHVPVV